MSVPVGRLPAGQGVREQADMNHQESNTTENLLARLDDGDRSALSPLIALHRNYLKKVVESRMEDDLRRRIDPSDVVQEAQLVASQRLD